MEKINLKIRNVVVLLVALALSGSTFAGHHRGMQGEGNKADRIEALRIAFISQQLNLTPQEAQKFWPIYNSYKSDLGEIRKNFKAGDGQQLTAQQQLDLEQKKLDLKKKYAPQFEGALGAQKLNQLYNLDQKFMQKLKELREQRMQQRGMGGGMQGQGQGPPATGRAGVIK